MTFMSMETIKDIVEVIINEGGLTCTTTNPFGNEKPCYYDFDHYDHDYGGNIQSPDEAAEYANAVDEWKQAENDRITYDIENQDYILHRKLNPVCCGNFDKYGGCCNNPFPEDVVVGEQWKFEPGTIHRARIENGKAVIL